MNKSEVAKAGLFYPFGIIQTEIDRSSTSSGTFSLRRSNYYNETSLVEEQLQLLSLFREGDENAKRTLITSNMPMIVYLAQSYANHGKALFELIMAGCSGLVDACEQFEAKNDSRFSTYANKCISLSIERIIAKA
jgi:DNA-directed RNA polymerase sigma subunit (sigma70/sigma32)